MYALYAYEQLCFCWQSVTAPTPPSRIFMYAGRGGLLGRVAGETGIVCRSLYHGDMSIGASRMRFVGVICEIHIVQGAVRLDEMARGSADKMRR